MTPDTSNHNVNKECIMTPAHSSTNINHLLGSQLHSVEHQKKSSADHSADTNPSVKPNNTNIADKVTLNSLHNNSEKPRDHHDDEQDHENNNIEYPKQSNGFLLNTSSQSSVESSINITTKEGDTVSLNFSRASNSEQTFVNNSSGFAYTSSSTSSVALNISIEGDLNHEEKKSIFKLVERIEEIVDKFNKRETQDALHKIQELNIKSEALSQFSFNYRQSTTQTALLAYQAVGDLAKPAPALEDIVINDASKPVATSAELVENINNVAHDVDEILEQENPFATLIGIFNEINKIKQPESASIENRLMEFASFIREIFKDIKENTDRNKPQDVLASKALDTLDTKTSPLTAALENTL